MSDGRARVHIDMGAQSDREVLRFAQHAEADTAAAALIVQADASRRPAPDERTHLYVGPTPEGASGYPLVRDSYRHRASATSDRDLEVIRALVLHAVRAIAENDRDAIRELVQLGEQHLDIAHPTRRLRHAVAAVEEEVAHVRASGAARPLLLIWMLRTAIDERFGELDESVVTELLQKAAKSNPGARGRGHFGPRAALAQLMAACRAFDCATVAEAELRLRSAKGGEPKK